MTLAERFTAIIRDQLMSADEPVSDWERQFGEALAAELAPMAAALKPFADCCAYIDAAEDDEEWAKFRLLIGDYRRAKAALDGLPSKSDGDTKSP